jgi:hypothetical protein
VAVIRFPEKMAPTEQTTLCHNQDEHNVNDLVQVNIISVFLSALQMYSPRIHPVPTIML